MVGYGKKLKKILQYKTLSIPLKKPNNSLAFSDFNKVKFLKIHVHETFQLHHNIHITQHVIEVENFLEFSSSVSLPEKYFTPNEFIQTIQEYTLKVTYILFNYRGSY